MHIRPLPLTARLIKIDQSGKFQVGAIMLANYEFDLVKWTGRGIISTAGC